MGRLLLLAERLAPPLMESLPERNTDEVNANRLLQSRSASEINALKSEFVVQLYTQDGPFWEEIREIRRRRGITATVEHPSNFREYFLHPEDEPEWPGEPGDSGYSEEKEETHYNFVEGWRRDLDSVICSTVPQRYCDPGDPKKDPLPWRRFVAACVLHDPPDTDLESFVEYGGPYPQLAPLLRDEDGKRPENLPMMVEPPIVQLRDGNELASIEYGYWMSVLAKVWELHLKPRGLEFSKVLKEIHEKYPEIMETYHEALRQNPLRHYIKVSEDTTAADVDNAFRMLSVNHKTRPKQGHPGRDVLVCVQCAILYDEHNERDSNDPRRKKWTYEKLAKKFGLPSARSAKAHVREGRERLRNKLQPKE